MTMEATRNPAEMLLDWAAPAVLASGCAWSAWTLAGAAAGAGAGAVALAAGMLSMRMLGQPLRGQPEAAFEPVSFEDVQDDNELLLDDPLIDVEEDSRVVRLFDREKATPGEMVCRIEGFLGKGRRRPSLPAEEGSAAPPDASAVLYAALANIRASLR